MRLNIKQMASHLSIIDVENILKQEEVEYVFVQMGRAETVDYLTAKQREQINSKLMKLGLELIFDKKMILIERIKTLIIESIRYSDVRMKVNFSSYLTEELHYNYSYLSNLFSVVEGITIERFIISNKIERIKELITYNKLNITEIAEKLHYSSVAHLSNQFKKDTGYTTSSFRALQVGKLLAIENG